MIIVDVHRVIGLALLATQVLAQPERLEFSHRIASEHLNEQRLITVSVPNAPGMAAKKTYPTLFVLDGEWAFGFAVGAVSFLSNDSFGHVPDMIVVGLPNTDRQRDMSAAGFQDYLSFLELEVIPLVNAQYPASGFSLIYGWSSASGICTQLLARRPGLFDAYLASGSGIGPRTRSYLASQLPGNQYRNQFLYVNAEGGGVRADAMRTYAELIDALRPEGLTWKFEILEDTTHVDALAEGLQAGLSLVFSRFRVPASTTASGPDAVVSFLQEVQASYRTRVSIPPGAFIESASIMLHNQQLSNAVALLERASELQPDTASLSGALGDVHAQAVNYRQAAQAYAQAARKSGNDQQSLMRYQALHQKMNRLAREDERQ